MRLITLILFSILYQNISFAQDTLSKPYSKRINNPASFAFSMSGYDSFFFKNQLVSDAYNINPGIQFDYRMGVKDLFGFGIFVNKATANIENPTFLTNFNTVRLREKGFFGYYLHPVNNRFELEGQLGYAKMSIKHFDDFDYFKLKYDGFFSSIGMLYAIHPMKTFVIFGQIQYFGYNGNKIIINDADRSYVTRAHKIAFQMGIRFQLFEKKM